MKRILATALAVLLIATMAIGGSIAYLTSTDNATNTFTMGEVEIEQIEQERGEGDEMQPFSNHHLLLPAHQFQQTGSTDTSMADEDNWDTSTGAVDKFVSVKNTGKTDAWVRTIFAFENTGNIDSDKLIFKNWNNKANVTPVDDVAEIDGVLYKLYVYTYPTVLEPNDTTGYSLKQVAMAAQADNEVVDAIRKTENGDNDREYTILVATQAVQAVNMIGDNGQPMTATEALNAAFYPITAQKNPWLMGENAGADDDDNDDDDADLTISSATELLAFAQQVNGTNEKAANNFAGKTVKLTANIDLNDLSSKSWTPIGNQTNYFAGTFDGGNHTIKNLKIEQTKEGWNSPTVSCDVGLFGYSNGMTVKNLTIDNQNQVASDAGDDLSKYTVDITGNSCVGAIVGYGSGITIKNCHVKNVVVNSATVISEDDENDPYTNGRTVGGYAGGIAGYIDADGKLEDCTVTNVHVFARCYTGYMIGYFTGDSSEGLEKKGNSSSNCTMGWNGDELGSDGDGCDRHATAGNKLIGW